MRFGARRGAGKPLQGNYKNSEQIVRASESLSAWFF
jgi:hypothetical protein